MSEKGADSENSTMKNIVIVGGSLAAAGVIVNLKSFGIPKNYRIVIIEKHSHFHYMFAFPRAIVVPGFEDELFVPYDKMFSSPSEGVFVNALVTKINKNSVELDRGVQLHRFGTAEESSDSSSGKSTVKADSIDFETREIPFEYLIYAAGANHPEPTNFNSADTKAEGVMKLKEYREKIEKATKVLVCGGGAAGIEIAAEIREHHPDKQVTLVHSRDHYMPGYQLGLHQKVKKILDGFGVIQILAQRVVVPTGGFVDDGVMKKVKTTGGLEIDCDLQVMCTGLIPNSGLIESLSPQSVDPKSKYINTKPTLQLVDDRYPHIFAAGDVTNSTDVKTGSAAWNQGYLAIQNIVKLILQNDTECIAPPVEPTKPSSWWSWFCPPKKSSDPPSLELVKKTPFDPQIMLYIGTAQGAGQVKLFGYLFTAGTWLVKRWFSYNVGATRAWTWLGYELTPETKPL
ncbi:hypothetical protein BJ742DRAFT_819133 [Cladochytrium replicatum]|nr:hypothetical protein BJ742DRAFT_819133 [Cladochytrium replicatum]